MWISSLVLVVVIYSWITCFISCLKFRRITVKKKKFFSFIYCPHCMACGIFIPHSGIEPRPLPWKCKVLPTRSPGNSLWNFFFNFCVLILLENILGIVSVLVFPLYLKKRFWSLLSSILFFERVLCIDLISLKHHSYL